MEGETVLSGSLTGYSTAINTSSLISGSYILKAVIDGKTSAEMIMIQK